MQRSTSTNWSVGNPITAARLQNFNEEFDRIFKELSNENLALTYDIQGQLTQIVDSENTITINIDWSQWTSNPAKLFVQKVGDPAKWTISYDANGFPSTIVYA